MDASGDVLRKRALCWRLLSIGWFDLDFPLTKSRRNGGPVCASDKPLASMASLARKPRTFSRHARHGRHEPRLTGVIGRSEKVDRVLIGLRVSVSPRLRERFLLDRTGGYWKPRNMPNTRNGTDSGPRRAIGMCRFCQQPMQSRDRGRAMAHFRSRWGECTRNDERLPNLGHFPRLALSLAWYPAQTCH